MTGVRYHGVSTYKYIPTGTYRIAFWNYLLETTCWKQFQVGTVVRTRTSSKFKYRTLLFTTQVLRFFGTELKEESCWNIFIIIMRVTFQNHIINPLHMLNGRLEKDLHHCTTNWSYDYSLTNETRVHISKNCSKIENLIFNNSVWSIKSRNILFSSWSPLSHDSCY